MTKFRFYESIVAEELGVSRGDLKFWRDQRLKKDRDWKKIGGEIALSLRGIRRVLHEHKVRDPLEALSRIEKKAAGKNGNGPNELILVGSKTHPVPRHMTIINVPMNPRVVLAVDEYGSRELIWVGRNSNFAIGDKIDVAPHETQEGIWQLLSALPLNKRRPYWK
jgi:hypothetical protein